MVRRQIHMMSLMDMDLMEMVDMIPMEQVAMILMEMNLIITLMIHTIPTVAVVEAKEVKSQKAQVETTAILNHLLLAKAIKPLLTAVHPTYICLNQT